MGSSKFHLTQSLLSAWLYALKSQDGFLKFLDALNRVREPPTRAMLDGIRFEGCVNACLDGNPIEPDHEWHDVVVSLTETLRGSQQQVNLKRDVIVDGVCFELQGVLDFLRAGKIFDTKFSKTYHLNKYLASPQHPMYFFLVPEAYEFEYLISDGKDIFHEIYRPDEVVPIETTIRQFMQYLDKMNLVDLYAQNFELESFYRKKEKQ